MSATEIARLQAVDGDQATTGQLPPGSCSLVVLNPLSAPIYILWSQGVPSASAFDLVVPGNALMAVPVPSGASALSAVVLYPGGTVPTGDGGSHAVLSMTDNNQGAFVGPLA